MYNCGVQKVGRTYKLVKKLTVIFVQFVCICVGFESIEIPRCFLNEFFDEKNIRNLQIQQNKMSETRNILYQQRKKKIVVNIAF